MIIQTSWNQFPSLTLLGKSMKFQFSMSQRRHTCNVWKYCILHLVSTIFPTVFMDGFPIRMTMERHSDVSTVGDLGSIFKVTAGLSMWKYYILHLISKIFLKVLYQWLSIMAIWWPWTESCMYQRDLGSIFKVTAGLSMWKYCI